MKTSPYQISAFTHAARLRSISRAAAFLGVTQSSITQHIAKLEQRMGTQLFVRRRDGLELTSAGRELFEVSDRLTTLEQLVEERVQNYSDLASGHLRIVATAPRPAMPIVAAYGAAFPNVEIEFSLFSWTICMAKIRDREVDVAVFTEPGEADGIFKRELGQTRYMAYVRRDHPLANRRSVSLKEIASEPVILPENGSFTQRVVGEKMKSLDLEFSRVVKTTTFPVVKEAVLHGVGIGLLLEDSLFPSTNLVALKIREMPETYCNSLVVPQDKRDLRLIRSFIDVAFQDSDGKQRAVT